MVIIFFPNLGNGVGFYIMLSLGLFYSVMCRPIMFLIAEIFLTTYLETYFTYLYKRPIFHNTTPSINNTCLSPLWFMNELWLL